MKKKVLIVEDEPTTVTFLERILCKNGFCVANAENGKSALEKINMDPPDIILSDIIMPEMDGFELFNCLLRSEETADIPLVFLSAVDDPRQQLKGLRLGAGEYLTKPLDGKDLIETIEKVLTKAEKYRTRVQEVDFGGNLGQVGLTEIVQVIEINEKTGELTLTDTDKAPIGCIFFRTGKIIHAISGALEGEEALYDLISQREGHFTFYIREVSVPESISQQNMSLLFEASRLADEAKTLHKMIRNPDVSLKLNSDELPDDRDENIPAETQDRIFAMINDGRTVREIIDSAFVSRLRTATFLVELLKTGTISVGEDGKKKEQERTTTQSGDIHMLVRGNLVDKLKEIDGTSFTGIIDIQGRSEPASIFISNGKIINAFHGNTTATKALFRIFSELGGACSIKPADFELEPVIDAPLDELFAGASQEIAWRRRLKYDLSAIRVIPKQKNIRSDVENNTDMMQILDLIRRHRRMKAIIDACPLSDFKACTLMEELRDKGVVAYEKAED